jgi:hypothetical protein
MIWVSRGNRCTGVFPQTPLSPGEFTLLAPVVPQQIPDAKLWSHSWSSLVLCLAGVFFRSEGIGLFAKSFQVQRESWHSDVSCTRTACCLFLLHLEVQGPRIRVRISFQENIPILKLKFTSYLPFPFTQPSPTPTHNNLGFTPSSQQIFLF